MTEVHQDAELTFLFHFWGKMYCLSHMWYEKTKCEWPTCVNNSQDLGRHSVNTKPNNFLAHFY